MLDHLSDALDSFRCYKDADIEKFLREKALEFLGRGWCSVYLILDEALFDAGRIQIDAYFTLSHKTLITKDVSRSQMQEISGFREANSVHFVLIGQLGKHIEHIENAPDRVANITSREILDFAFEVIRSASNLIPCRCALVECSANPKVQKVYTDYKFSFFQDDGEHHQFYKRI